MKILIDIGHPAHVHLMKNLFFALKSNNHEIYVTVKENLVSANELLSSYDISFTSIGSKSDSLFKKALKQISYDLKISKLIKNNGIELGLGSSMNLAHASRFTKMKSILMDDDDDEVQPLFVKYAHPFCDVLLSPNVLKRKKKNTIYYPGYHELAYLHSNYFTPDPSVLKEVGLKSNDSFFILRFNVFKAHHDKGIKGISLENKIKLVEKLSGIGKVFITTEREIEPELRHYLIKISPEKIHHFLAYATMFIGDSQTMSSEAAVLGTPSIRSNSFVGRISYLEEQEHKYGLTYGFKPDQTDAMFARIDELLSMPNLKEEWQYRRMKMLKDKIDVTSFFIWFVENYPQSVKISKENPEIFEQFK